MIFYFYQNPHKMQVLMVSIAVICQGFASFPSEFWIAAFNVKHSNLNIDRSMNMQYVIYIDRLQLKEMENRDCILSYEDKKLFNVLQIKIFDISQSIDICSNRTSINQMKDFVAAEHSIFRQIKKIFTGLDIEFLFDLIGGIQINYLRISALLFKQIENLQKALSQPLEFTGNTVKTTQTQQIKAEKAQTLRLKNQQFNKLGGIHLHNQNYQRGIEPMNDYLPEEVPNQVAPIQKKKQKITKQEFLHEVIQQINHQTDVQKDEGGNEIDKFIFQRKNSKNIISCISYEKELTEIIDFFKISELQAFQFLSQGPTLQSKTAEDFASGIIELEKDLALKKNLEKDQLNNKMKQTLIKIKEKMHQMQLFFEKEKQRLKQLRQSVHRAKTQMYTQTDHVHDRGEKISKALKQKQELESVLKIHQQKMLKFQDNHYALSNQMKMKQIELAKFKKSNDEKSEELQNLKRLFRQNKQKMNITIDQDLRKPKSTKKVINTLVPQKSKKEIKASHQMTDQQSFLATKNMKRDSKNGKRYSKQILSKDGKIILYDEKEVSKTYIQSTSSNNHHQNIKQHRQTSHMKQVSKFGFGRTSNNSNTNSNQSNDHEFMNKKKVIIGVTNQVENSQQNIRVSQISKNSNKSQQIPNLFQIAENSRIESSRKQSSRKVTLNDYVYYDQKMENLDYMEADQQRSRSISRAKARINENSATVEKKSILKDPSIKVSNLKTNLFNYFNQYQLSIYPYNFNTQHRIISNSDQRNQSKSKEENGQQNLFNIQKQNYQSKRKLEKIIKKSIINSPKSQILQKQRNLSQFKENQPIIQEMQRKSVNSSTKNLQQSFIQDQKLYQLINQLQNNQTSNSVNLQNSKQQLLVQLLKNHALKENINVEQFSQIAKVLKDNCNTIQCFSDSKKVSPFLSSKNLDLQQTLKQIKSIHFSKNSSCKNSNSGSVCCHLLKYFEFFKKIIANLQKSQKSSLTLPIEIIGEQKDESRPQMQSFSKTQFNEKIKKRSYLREKDDQSERIQQLKRMKKITELKKTTYTLSQKHTLYEQRQRQFPSIGGHHSLHKKIK